MNTSVALNLPLNLPFEIIMHIMDYVYNPDDWIFFIQSCKAIRAALPSIYLLKPFEFVHVNSDFPLQECCIRCTRLPGCSVVNPKVVSSCRISHSVYVIIDACIPYVINQSLNEHRPIE